MNKFKLDPKAEKTNIFFFNDYRLSIIHEGVVRIEKDSSKRFNDEITQFAFVRKTNFNDFKTDRDTTYLKIIFADYELCFNGSIDTSYIVYNGQKLPLDNSKNLKGTYGTVDGMNGEIIVDGGGNREIGYGVCSKNGVAIIDDKDSYCLNEELEFTHKNEDEIDVYVFFFPNDYQNAVKALFDISGYPPLLPKYAFGNWWSRYHAYSSEEYLYLMDSFKKEDIPFSVATIDMDWHYSNWSNNRNLFEDIGMPKEEFIDPKSGKYIIDSWNNGPWSIGWTGYSWNKKLFPNYKETLKELRKKGLHITLNLHPADGIAFYEDCYEESKKQLGLNLEKKETILFDLTDKKFKEHYFKNILGSYQKDGVDFWWIDWQQGENSKLPGLSPMWLCNHYFYLENGKFNYRPLILSRFAGIGSHRYPLGFSGDSYQSYDSLKYLIKTTPMASNVGFTYWSHDIGGHMHGYKDGEQFLKFIQFGIFSPINRLHCSCEEMFDKNPLLFLKGNRDMIKHFLRLRHKMIPYIYSFMHETHLEGTPLCKPLYYDCPKDELAYAYSDVEYIFANDLLVRPFNEKADENGFNVFKMYFPEGKYFDLFYGYAYEGEKEITIHRENESMPVFIKEGSFFVLDSRNHGNKLDNPKEIDVTTSTGNGKYIFYEDNGKLRSVKTIFLNKREKGKQIIKISLEGDLALIRGRRYNFKILDLHDGVSIKTKKCRLINKSDCGEFFEFSIDSVEQTASIELLYEEKSKFEEKKIDLCRRLSYLDDRNDERQKIYSLIQKSTKTSEMEVIIKESKLQIHNKKALIELL